MKNLHIENSYNIWDKHKMLARILDKCQQVYGSPQADLVLNRTYRGMYIEWWLHNIGYWVTIPFIRINWIKDLNERFKHVDLEEH